MLRLTVHYPIGDGKFDLDYYCNQHASLVHRLCDPIGLKSFQVDRDEQANTVTAHLLFEASDTLLERLNAASGELRDDAANYTDVEGEVAMASVVHNS